MMTWEGSQLMGTQAIIEKINVRRPFALSPSPLPDSHTHPSAFPPSPSHSNKSSTGYP